MRNPPLKRIKPHSAVHTVSKEGIHMKPTIFMITVLLLGGCSFFDKQEEILPTNAPEAEKAKATIQNTKGEVIGEILFKETDLGVEMSTVLNSLPPGDHGIHIHEFGKCEAPTFETAGAHFNPTGKQHGVDNPKGPHAGDLPNLTAGEDGSVQLNFTAESFTLKKGVENSLFDTDGSTVIIHEKADDYKTDPAGNSGARIACGVIK